MRGVFPSRLALLLGLLPAAAVPLWAVAAEPFSPPAVLVSRQLAESRGLAPGDEIRLTADPGGGGGRIFRVSGIYEPVADPMRLHAERLEVRLHLPDLLRLAGDPADPLDADTVDGINLLARPGEDLETLARDIRRRFPGMRVTPTLQPDDGTNPFTVLERFHVAIALIAVLGSTAFLLALMVIRADERRETTGILRLVGFSRGRVLVGVLAEGLLLALAGAALGLLVAAGLQGGFNRFFQWYYDTALVFMRITPAIAARCLALALPLGVAAGLVASWTILRRDIIALLRR